MKTPPMPPRNTTRVRLTREQQRVLFAHHTAHDGKSLRELSQWAAARFKLLKAPAPSSVSDVLKRCRAESEETEDAVATRLSYSLEHKLVLWIARCESLGMRLTGVLIRSKAELLRDAMLADGGVPSPLDEKLRKLKFSNGWLYSFQLRNKIIPSARQDDGVNDNNGHSGEDEENDGDGMGENEDSDEEERAIEAFDEENSSGRE
ncbi:putative Tigger transposable elementderived protein 6 [Globisporangium polare]